MSHGGGDDSIEPDLTPLLDLVMQLLMFFIVNVRFVTEQVSGEIQLPTSTSAKPISKGDADALFVNLKNAKNKKFWNNLAQDDKKRLQGAPAIVLAPAQPPMSPLEAKSWLRDEFVKAQDKAGGADKVKTVIHFRADGDLELNELFTMMNFCKAAGYRKLAIRATVKNKG
ncbi:MAG: biopolymer transporter ExbD [Gemmataceae bacterium]|nr:biopolymer transporter ExbD [Gemmataceae bacterium]